MTKIFLKFKKPYFWPISPILGGKKRFPENSGTYNLIRFSSAIPKFREKLMIQFQENNPTESRMGGQTGLISWNPSDYCYGSNKYKRSGLAFKSQI